MSSGPDKSYTANDPLLDKSACHQFANENESGYDHAAGDACVKNGGSSATPGDSGRSTRDSASAPAPASSSSSDGHSSDE